MTALDAALTYTEMGLYVFPCNGKQPLVQWGNESTTDPETVRKWWTTWPEAGIGIDCGKSGLVVVDLDVKGDADGPGNWQRQINGHKIPHTFNVHTPSGGWHGWYRDPARKYRNSAGLIAPGVDVRAVGGYVLAPGSPGYRWHAETPLSLSEIPVLPDGVIPAASSVTGHWTQLDRDELDPRDLAALEALERLHGHGAYRSGEYIGITRPGKIAGLSASIGHIAPGTVRVFSSNWPQLPEGVYDADGLIAIADGDITELSPVDEMRSRLLQTGDLDHIPEPEPLIKGIIYRDSLVWLQGKSGDGKSFLALDMAGCIATGDIWQVYPTTRGDVLYIVAEGVSGIRWRVRAWEDAMGQTMTGIRWLPNPVQADDLVQWSALIQLVAELQPALIVIDTQARVTVGLEENAAKDMGVFVDKLEKLRKASAACVLVVHHQGRNGEHMRGSTALDGAAATIIKVVKEEDTLTVSCTKQKDAEPFDEISLRLTSRQQSAVLVLSDGLGRLSHNGAAMKMARRWWELFGTELVTESKVTGALEITKPTFYRNVKELVRSGVVEKDTESARYTQYRLTREPDPTNLENPRSEGYPQVQVGPGPVGPPLKGVVDQRTKHLFDPPDHDRTRPDHRTNPLQTWSPGSIGDAG